MKKDAFWQTRINDYVELYAFFVNLMQKKVPNMRLDDIDSHWHHFIEDICDCDGCREDSDCTIHIDISELDDDDFEH